MVKKKKHSRTQTLTQSAPQVCNLGLHVMSSFSKIQTKDPPKFYHQAF